jgi:hypothetical protein
MTQLELAVWKAKLDEKEESGSLVEGVRVTRGRIKRARKERRITSGADIIIGNILPFLQLLECIVIGWEILPSLFLFYTLLNVRVADIILAHRTFLVETT